MKLNLKTLLIGGALLLFVFVIGPRFFGGGDAPPAQEPPVAQVQPEPTLPEAPGAAVQPEPTVARPKASPTARPPKPTAAPKPAATACRPRPPRRPLSPQLLQHRARRGP